MIISCLRCEFTRVLEKMDSKTETVGQAIQDGWGCRFERGIGGELHWLCPECCNAISSREFKELVDA